MWRRLGDRNAMRHGGVSFIDADGVNPFKVATEYDYVLFVGDYLAGLQLREFFEELGVAYDIYPLEPLAAPTIYSLLGVIGLLREKAMQQNAVAVIDGGAGGLLHAAWKLVYGPAAGDLWLDVHSPLHYRLLFALRLLSRGGVDLSREAERNIIHAFSGGDAARSDRVLLAADIEKQLGISGLAASTYLGKLNTWLGELLDSLDPDLEGAVSVLGFENVGKNAVIAYLGCRLLMHPNACAKEQEAARKPLEGLLAKHGLSLRAISQVWPEEAACIAYPEYKC